MLEILAWCRAHGIPRASLHASPEGRLLYEALGFQSTNEMRMGIVRVPSDSERVDRRR
jgi:hypothetical protein